METIDFCGDAPTVSEPCRHKGIMFSRYGANDPELIIEAIEEFFNVELISEYDERFYEIVISRNESDRGAQEVGRCEICGAELLEGDDTYCEDCMVTMGGGGAAHHMAEEIRKAKKKKKRR